ncbi:hypothetical protein ACLB1G_15940 [Oxalobacteraceae bacterium A2-2]
MSYESWNDGGLTPLERAAGLWRIIYGRNNGECSCGVCEQCWKLLDAKITQKKKELESSARFKDAAKIVAGLSGNRETKLALLQRMHQESLDSAIVRYMAEEMLPDYYASILKSPNCIAKLMEGVIYKICKIRPEQSLTEQIGNLSSVLRRNPDGLTAYDRVTKIQRFIHFTVDQHLGMGAAQTIPIKPMKNALSAARLHLSILDVLDHRPGYVAYIDALSNAVMQLEYNEPRLSSAPIGKRSWPRWRVRHYRPLSYYFPQKRRAILEALKNLDEGCPWDEFVYEALLLYAEA